MTKICTESCTESKSFERFFEVGDSVFFPKVDRCVHKSFYKKYVGMTIPEARRKMRTIWNTQSHQDEMIHYLKHKRLLRL